MAQYLPQAAFVAMGGDATVGALTYDRHEFRARKIIDGVTFGRVQSDDPQREAVKNLVYELVAAYSANAALRQQAMGGNVSSWSNDGVSVNVKQATPVSEKSLDAQAENLVYRFLDGEYSQHGTPLLYRGLPICP